MIGIFQKISRGKNLSGLIGSHTSEMPSIKRFQTFFKCLVYYLSKFFRFLSCTYILYFLKVMPCKFYYTDFVEY